MQHARRPAPATTRHVYGTPTPGAATAVVAEVLLDVHVWGDALRGRCSCVGYTQQLFTQQCSHNNYPRDNHLINRIHFVFNPKEKLPSYSQPSLLEPPITISTNPNAVGQFITGNKPQGFCGLSWYLILTLLLCMYLNHLVYLFLLIVLSCHC